MFYSLSCAVLIIAFVAIDLLATRNHPICRRVRMLHKDKHQFVERIGMLFAIVGALGILIGGLWTRDLISETREKSNKIHQQIEVEAQDIEPIKFAHYFAFATNRDYVSTTEYFDREKRIAEYITSRRLNQKAIEEDKRRVDQIAEKFAFACSVAFVLISVFTLNLGGGLISRSMWERLENRYKDDTERKSSESSETEM